MGNLVLYAGIAAIVVVGGYLWWQGQSRKLDNAIRQPGFADKLAGALSPVMNKRGMKWNPSISRWVDTKTGKPLSQGEQVARSGCKACQGMATANPERVICLRLCKG